jgi:hypothetical protein
MAGMKYAVVLATITLITWTIVEQVSNPEAAASLLVLVGSTAPPARDLIDNRNKTEET